MNTKQDKRKKRKYARVLRSWEAWAVLFAPYEHPDKNHAHIYKTRQIAFKRHIASNGKEIIPVTITERRKP